MVKMSASPHASVAESKEARHRASVPSIALPEGFLDFKVSLTNADAQVRKTPSWPRSWANFSIF